jgi:hypothetical protein
MEITEKREAAKMAPKLATPPKLKTVNELSTEVLVPRIGNEGKTYVKFLIRNSVYTRITGPLEALGIKVANANPGTRNSVVDFRGNHKNFLGSIPMLQKAKILNCKLTIQVGTTKLQHLRNTFRFPLRA